MFILLRASEVYTLDIANVFRFSLLLLLRALEIHGKMDDDDDIDDDKKLL